VADVGSESALPPLPLGIRIEANVGSVAEAEQAASAGADGIGLVRTELIFLGRTIAPGLNEQRAVYRRILDAMGGRPVVFRTLDIGGDKPAGFEPSEREANPALGAHPPGGNRERSARVRTRDYRQQCFDIRSAVIRRGSRGVIPRA
jgi:phosphoenolpyruvate synthase/pyruvate phosphate dikinase